MSVIDLKNCSDFEYYSAIKKINKCLNIAYKYNGKVFGEYVRDYLVPKYHDKDCKLMTNSIDIWFNNMSDLNSFKSVMGDHFVSFTDKMINRFYHPDAIRQIYHLSYGEVTLATFEIFYFKEDTPPAVDFNVNTLFFDGKVYNDISLYNLVYHKKALMYPTYASYIVKCSDNTRKYHMEDINHYTNRGWTITPPPNYKFVKIDKTIINIRYIEPIKLPESFTDNLPTVQSKIDDQMKTVDQKHQEILQKFDESIASLRSVIVDLLNKDK